jgi:hypothetical protein
MPVPDIGSGKCPCAIADSFNVRVIDLINPACPHHGPRSPRYSSWLYEQNHPKPKPRCNCADMLGVTWAGDPPCPVHDEKEPHAY